jgi:hypothetical protein
VDIVKKKGDKTKEKRKLIFFYIYNVFTQKDKKNTMQIEVSKSSTWVVGRKKKINQIVYRGCIINHA